MRLISFFILLMMLYWLSQKLLQHSALEKIALDLPDSVELDTSRGYVIPENKRLIYTLSQSPEKLWISSSALLTGGNNKTASYPYNLMITVRDNDGEVIYQSEFHHQSSASKIVELTVNGQQVPESFLANTTQQLSAPENIHFQLPPGATTLEISQHVGSPQITGVVLRAYQFVQRSSRVSAIDLWQRLSQKQRARLTENFPFEETFLSNDERANLAEYRWQPLVPQGDEDQNYHSVLLYRINKQFIANKKHLLSQYEHHADAYKRVSFPIEVAGLYRLEGQHSFQRNELLVDMHWFNVNDTQVKKSRLSFDSGQFSQEIELQPGLVTFTSSLPTSINLFAINGLVEEHDHFSQAVMLLPGQELEYRVEHSSENIAIEGVDTQNSTPMQIQARAFAEQALSTGPDAQVTVRLQSAGKTIENQQLAIEYIPDIDSQMVNEEFFNWLGFAQKLYIEVTAPADTLIITTNQPVLLTVYTRLKGMPAIRVLPQEKRDWFDYPSGVPDWFSVRPENWSTLINVGGVRLLKHYHRSLLEDREPPDPDETYQSLLSDFNNLDLLDVMVENPFFGQTSTIEENTVLNFAPVANTNAFTDANTSANASTSTKAAINDKPIEKRWLFVKHDDQPREIQWLKNDIRQTSFWLAGKWGIVNQNTLFVNESDKVQFLSPQHDIQWWHNNVPREQARWQQRRVALLAKASVIKMQNSKREPDEIISVVVYSTSAKPAIVKVSFDGIIRDPLVKDSYSITQRQFHIQPSQAYSGFQLSGDKRIVARQAFSIPLQADIPTGNYQMTIEHLEGDDLFISVVKRVIKPKPIIERYRTQAAH